MLESDADSERFNVRRRFRMRDGERFFAAGRDRANYDLRHRQMQLAGRWRSEARRTVLGQLKTMGRDTQALDNALGITTGTGFGMGGRVYPVADLVLNFSQDSFQLDSQYNPQREMTPTFFDFAASGLPSEMARIASGGFIGKGGSAADFDEGESTVIKDLGLIDLADFPEVERRISSDNLFSDTAANPFVMGGGMGGLHGFGGGRQTCDSLINELFPTVGEPPAERKPLKKSDGLKKRDVWKTACCEPSN